MLRKLGPDTGFDSIGDWDQASALSRFLNRLDEEDKLSKTVLYNLNPRDNEVLATMIGNFNDEWFVIGTSYQRTFTSSGQLSMKVNDWGPCGDDSDNAGRFMISVTIE